MSANSTPRESTGKREKPAEVSAAREGTISKWAYLLFGIFLLVTPLVFIVQWPEQVPPAKQYLRVIVALGAALIGASLPGILKMRLPGVRAVGAAAFFALVFLIDPPDILQEQSAGAPTPSIVVGAKDFLESSILAELIAQTIEARTGLDVKARHNIGESVHVFNSLRRGEISMYPEYSGTILSEHLGLADVRAGPAHDVAAIGATLSENGGLDDLEYIGNFGINNPYVIVMLRSRALELGVIGTAHLPSLDRLAEVSQWAEVSFGSTYTFYNRPDGFPGLVSEYELKFSESPIIMRHDQKVRNLLEGAMDVTDFYGTDPPLHQNSERFVVIDDNRGFFPDYWVGVLARAEVLDRSPELADALRSIRGLTNSEMASLIDEATRAELTVDELGRRVTARARLSEIVRSYAKSKRLLQ